MYELRNWISIFIGLLLMLLGVLPLLSILGVIGIGFDTWFGKVVSVFAYVLAFGGIALIVDSIHEIVGASPTFGWITLVIGFIVLALGIVQVLFTFGILPWQLPSPPEVFYYALFILEGVLLFISGFIPG